MDPAILFLDQKEMKSLSQRDSKLPNTSIIMQFYSKIVKTWLSSYKWIELYTYTKYYSGMEKRKFCHL